MDYWLLIYLYQCSANNAVLATVLSGKGLKDTFGRLFAFFSKGNNFCGLLLTFLFTQLLLGKESSLKGINWLLRSKFIWFKVDCNWQGRQKHFWQELPPLIVCPFFLIKGHLDSYEACRRWVCFSWRYSYHITIIDKHNLVKCFGKDCKTHIICKH